MAMATINICSTALPHLLEKLTDKNPPYKTVDTKAANLEANTVCIGLTPLFQSLALKHVKFYLDEFIGLVQGG